MSGKQTEAGIDVVTDGEQGKASFFGYVVERFNGFERKPARPGEEGTPAGDRAANTWTSPTTTRGPNASRSGRADAAAIARHGVDICTGPISYKGHAAVQADIENLKAALQGLPHEEVFMPAIAPSYISATLPNEYYRTERSTSRPSPTRFARSTGPSSTRASSFRSTIPRLVTYYMMNPGKSVADCRRWAAQRVEAINYSLRDIPARAGPLSHVLQHRRRPARPRHGAEGHRRHPLQDQGRRVSRSRRPTRGTSTSTTSSSRSSRPTGKILIPGVISHTTNLVEHPELIAERIVRFAKLVGRENVIAGADCGFAASAMRFNDTHPSVAWLKFAALAEGARLATRRLWG